MQLVACVAENDAELACVKSSGCLGLTKRDSSSKYSSQPVSKEKYTDDIKYSLKFWERK